MYPQPYLGRGSAGQFSVEMIRVSLWATPMTGDNTDLYLMVSCRSVLENHIIPRLTEPQRRALERGGAMGLWVRLEEEREEALPEIKRSRPKVMDQCWPSAPVRPILTFLKLLSSRDQNNYGRVFSTHCPHCQQMLGHKSCLPCSSYPQNYYFERWMTGRVIAALPPAVELPPCILSAMVKKLDADDLDLMINHPGRLLPR